MKKFLCIFTAAAAALFNLCAQMDQPPEGDPSATSTAGTAVLSVPGLAVSGNALLNGGELHLDKSTNKGTLYIWNDTNEGTAALSFVVNGNETFRFDNFYSGLFSQFGLTNVAAGGLIFLIDGTVPAVDWYPLIRMNGQASFFDDVYSRKSMTILNPGSLTTNLFQVIKNGALGGSAFGPTGGLHIGDLDDAGAGNLIVSGQLSAGSLVVSNGATLANVGATNFTGTNATFFGGLNTNPIQVVQFPNSTMSALKILGGTNSTGNMLLINNGAGGVVFQIASNGNVGIGKAPGTLYILDITGNASISGNVTANSFAPGGGGKGFISAISDGLFCLRNDGITNFWGLVFGTNSPLGTNFPRISSVSTGAGGIPSLIISAQDGSSPAALGIGKAPVVGYALDVGGTAYVSGSFYGATNPNGVIGFYGRTKFSSPTDGLLTIQMSTPTNLLGVILGTNGPNGTNIVRLTPQNVMLGTAGVPKLLVTAQDGSSPCDFDVTGRFQTTMRSIAATNDPGLPGEICFDGSYSYFCVATNSWVRSAVGSTW